MIELDCPHCGYHLRIEPKFAGKRGRCKKCRGEIFVAENPSASSANPAVDQHISDVPLDVIDIPLAMGVSKGFAVTDDSAGIGVPGLVHVDPDEGGTAIDQIGDKFSNLGGGDGGPISFSAEPSAAFGGAPGVVNTFAVLGPLFWFTVFLLPPVGLVWSLNIDRNHPQRGWGVGTSVGLVVLAALCIAGGVGTARSGDLSISDLFVVADSKVGSSDSESAGTDDGLSGYASLPVYSGGALLPVEPIATVEGPLATYAYSQLSFVGSHHSGNFVEIQQYYYEAFPRVGWTCVTRFGFDGEAGRFMTIVAEKNGSNLFVDLVESPEGAYVTVVTPLEDSIDASY